MSRAQRIINWIEGRSEHFSGLRVPEGRLVGEQIVLRAWQKDEIRRIYDNENRTRRAVLSFGRKNGKGLALDTPIPTPIGWTTMGDLRPGDFVYGSDGQPTRVAFVSETHTDLRCWRLTFSDGSSVVADEQHQWLTRHRYRPWAKTRRNGSGFGGRPRTEVVTTPQIADSVLAKRADGGRECNHKLPVAPALASVYTPLPIDPYLLGAWIGDGSSSKGVLHCSGEDAPALHSQIGGNPVQQRGAAWEIRIAGLMPQLRDLGVLNNKHIPQQYLEAGTGQRWALLQGLMDTDGTVSLHAGKTTPRCSYTSIKREIAEGVWRLCRSLGLKATIREYRAKLNGEDKGPCFDVAFPASQESPVFRLQRKQERLPDTLGKRSNTLTIVSCEPVESVPTRCIQVEAEDSLFLCGHGCVPTHNTALAAMLLLVHLVGPEAITNTQLYSAAQSRDQAAILYGLAAKMVRMSPDLADFVGLRDSSKQLYCDALGTLYRALSADASTAYGLSPVFAVHDELGQVKGPRSELYEAIETGMSAHDAPLSLVISTQAPNEDALLSRLIDDGLSEADPRVIVSLYTVPMEDDPFAEESIRKANPAFGDFQNAEEVMDMARTASRMPSREAEFRNLILNQRVEAEAPLITRSVWEANGRPPEPMGACYAGLDLSETADLTAFVLVSDGENGISTDQVFWLPATGLEDKAKGDRVPYDLWRDQGHLRTTPGASIQYEYVAQEIVQMFSRYDIRKVAFDRYRMRHLRPWLINAGLSESFVDERFVDFGQGFVSMAPAINVLESYLLNHHLRHGMHPVLTMCAANAVAAVDPAGNRKLDKKRSTGRIDGIVALTMALATMSEDQNNASVFKTDIDAFTEDFEIA